MLAECEGRNGDLNGIPSTQLLPGCASSPYELYYFHEEIGLLSFFLKHGLHCSFFVGLAQREWALRSFYTEHAGKKAANPQALGWGDWARGQDLVNPWTYAPHPHLEGSSPWLS